MSLELHQKITIAEARTWLLAHTENIRTVLGIEGADAEKLDSLITDESLSAIRPQDFKYRKPRVTKSSSTSSERSQEPYNESLCDARVWNDGYGGQCSRKKVDGCRCCKTHQAAADKFGIPKEGFIDGERPDYHYNDETKAFIPWKDSTVEKPTKSKKKSDKPRAPTKCGLCGEIGHNKRSCPENPSVKPAKATVKDDEEVKATVTEIIDAVSHEKVEAEYELTESQQNAAGCGLAEEAQAGDGSQSPEFHPDTPDDANLVEISLEGIDYVYEKDTLIVRDDDFDIAGKFVDGEIVFDPAMGKMHKMKVAAL